MSRQLLKYHPDITKYTTIWMDTIRDGAFGLSNTNKLIRFYNGATGLKTGFTSGAGYCLSASAQREGLELIAVVMGCESSKERFAACKSLLDYGFAGFTLVTPSLSEELRVPVTLGTAESVEAVLGDYEPVLIDKAQKSQISQSITLDENVDAPVSKGQRLGTLTLQAGEQTLVQIPLVAKEGVNKLSWWQIFQKVLGSAALG